jgi:hypothetical protein
MATAVCPNQFKLVLEQLLLHALADQLWIAPYTYPPQSSNPDSVFGDFTTATFEGSAPIQVTLWTPTGLDAASPPNAVGVPANVSPPPPFSGGLIQWYNVGSTTEAVQGILAYYIPSSGGDPVLAGASLLDGGPVAVAPGGLLTCEVKNLLNSLI